MPHRADQGHRRRRLPQGPDQGVHDHRHPGRARDEWRRSTAQAILGLQFAPASKDRLQIVSVRREARAGERVQFRVFGLAPSESACLQVKGDFVRVKGKKSGDKIVRTLTLPTGNQRRVALVKTSDDEARTSLRVRNCPTRTTSHKPRHTTVGPASRDAGPTCVRAPGGVRLRVPHPTGIGTTHARGGESR